MKKRSLTVALWVMMAMLLSALSGAQEGTYRLQPLDTIHVRVYNEQYVDAIMPLGRDGNISAPFIGIVMAAGKTTSELEAFLAQEYVKKLKLRDPKVAVWIEAYRKIRASVTGFVVQPGVFDDFRPGETIITLLSRSGGAAPDRGDLKRCTLRRAGSRELIPVDLYSVLVKGDTSQIYSLEDGDELFVPELQRPFIYVLGAVQQPGPIQYREPFTIADAITSARGPIPIKSKLSEVYVLRRQLGAPEKRIRVNFVNYIRKGDSTQNITLLPGDLVYVSETKTPDLNQISSILNSVFFLDRLVTDGFLGLRIGR